MKKADVEIGGRYMARVSGRVVKIRITNPSIYKGWDAVNESTGRSVRVKTGVRLWRAAGGVWVIRSDDRYLTDEPSWTVDKSLAKRFTDRGAACQFFRDLAGCEIKGKAILEELAK